MPIDLPLADLNGIINAANDLMFSNTVIYILLATGVLFTVWSGFGQFHALTHGIGVIRGKYDRKEDPGAINHFQALSAALSATVGLGNIAGVAVAVALGGPGAVFWMWVIGVLGMALKMVEVTQTMLYRNTDDPDNPHGGPMFVLRDRLRKAGLGPLGWVLGSIFCITLLTSAITGGNMFQAWNVADTTNNYFDVPKVAVGIVLAVAVGAVIIGGIKRIGSVAGKLVPVMCVLYLLAAGYVLLLHLGDLPGLLVMIVRHGVGLESQATASGAFLGGTFGYALMFGVKRALFSSEAGQGSAPIAHAAAKCDEPVREGVVAGLEPFIDTIVVCTLTALVILASGAWNRGPEATFADDVPLVFTMVGQPNEQGESKWTIKDAPVPDRSEEAQRITGMDGWNAGESVFLLIEADTNDDTGQSLHRLTGEIKTPAGGTPTIEFEAYEGKTRPELAERGLYAGYAGSTLTAHAFDRVTPGLGKWLVTIAIWLFA
ncbi:MAG: amino acid carrier protein, partial [Planctomycetota bacterium]